MAENENWSETTSAADFLAALLRWDECHESVTRAGQEAPCEKPAVALRRDPEEGNPYPVCARHARANMLTLADLRAALAPHVAAQVAERDAEIERLRAEVEEAEGHHARAATEAMHLEAERDAALAQVATARRDALTEAADALPALAEHFKVVSDANERRLVEWCADRLRRLAAVVSP